MPYHSHCSETPQHTRQRHDLCTVYQNSDQEPWGFWPNITMKGEGHHPARHQSASHTHYRSHCSCFRFPVSPLNQHARIFDGPVLTFSMCSTAECAISRNGVSARFLSSPDRWMSVIGRDGRASSVPSFGQGG